MTSNNDMKRRLLILLYSLLSCCWCALPTNEKRLLDHLMTNHNKLIRPVTNASQAVKVTFGIEINQILKVEDRAQLIVTKVWVRQSWTNHLMKWNATEWNNIGSLMVGQKDVWIPDILLYNSGEPGPAGGTDVYKTQIAMYASGVHWWLSPAVFTSTCKINIKYFPFDHQYCKLQFGSWMHDAYQIEVHQDNREVITSNYVISSEWDIVEVKKQVNIRYYACCPNPYTDITFTMHLQRKPAFYVFNVIVPCLVLALTILFGFFFPPESGERVGLIITILLAMAVFMQIISGTLPVNSDTPKLSLFYMVILIECALSLATTCIVLVLHYRGEENQPYPMPRWIRKIFIDFLARKSGYLEKDCEEKEDSVPPSYGKMNEAFSDTSGLEHKENRIRYCAMNVRNRKKRSQKSLDLTTLQEIQKDIHHVALDMKDAQETEETNKDWKIVGKVLDRIFFMLFLLTVAISAVAILVPAYLHEENIQL